MFRDATNITVTTSLASCQTTPFPFDEIRNEIYLFYKSRFPTLISSVSIVRWNCSNVFEQYLEHLIELKISILIRQQIDFASSFVDYLQRQNYRLSNLIVDQTKRLNLSSITVNNLHLSDACTFADVAQDPICPMNSNYSICTYLSNSWNYVCRSRSTRNLHSTTINDNDSDTHVIPSQLGPWKIGLICCSSTIVFLFIVFLIGYFYRRYTHSRHLALSRTNLVENSMKMRQNGSMEFDEFPQPVKFIQSKRHESSFPMETNDQSTRQTSISSPSQINGNRNETIPSISEILINKTSNSTTIFDEVQGECHRSDGQPSFCLTSMSSKSAVDLCSIDENLSDEDAWKPILDLVNLELARLNEEEQEKTSI